MNQLDMGMHKWQMDEKMVPGEFVVYALRLVSGSIADRTRKY